MTGYDFAVHLVDGTNVKARLPLDEVMAVEEFVFPRGGDALLDHHTLWSA